MLGACADRDVVFRDGPPTPAEECQQIYDQVTAMVTAADRTCATASDCVRFGGSGTCNCAAFLGVNCSGDPMSRAAFDAITTQTGDAFTRYRALQCSVGPQICDCGPGVVDCVGGQCALVTAQSCFPVDGGVDAP